MSEHARNDFERELRKAQAKVDPTVAAAVEQIIRSGEHIVEQVSAMRDLGIGC